MKVGYIHFWNIAKHQSQKIKFYFDGDGADRIMKINDVKFQKIKSSYDLGKVWNDTTRKNNEEIDNNMSVNIEEIVK